MIKKKIGFITLLIIMTSCFASHRYSIKTSESAKVNVDRDPSYNLMNLYNSDIITNVDTNFAGGRVAFEIRNVDSLGSYLPLHPSGFFNFSMEGNTFIMSYGHGKAFWSNHWSCCTVGFEIEFDKNIQYIKRSKGKAPKIKDNSFYFTISRKELVKRKTSDTITVVLE